MDYRQFLVHVAVWFCKLGVLISDILTLPICFLIDKPWIHWRRKNIVWSKLEDENDPYSCYVRQVHYASRKVGKSATMDEFFRNSVSKFGPRKCLGTRQTFGEEDFTTKSGKVLKKLNLGNYEWLTFQQAGKRVEDISRGLLSIGVVSKKPVVILAETRVEWFLAAQACFRINVPVVTLYATLGEAGIAHGINETEAAHIITSVDLLPKIRKVIKDIPKVSNIVYMEGLKPLEKGEDMPNHVNLMSYTELEDMGKKATDVSFVPPEPDDLAILMYTSGSTGIPKGVMITNKNFMATINGFYDVIDLTRFGAEDTYIAYLPIAHAFELGIESYIFSLGVPVGYSGPHTLTDFSTAIKSPCLGDLKVLKPTLFAAVPLMLDRIRKSILLLAGPEESFSRMMFDFAIDYKRRWMHRGFQTPLIDRYVMKTYHDFMGGNLQFVICGSAPISPDTQDFIRSCLNVQVIQGYGMTETAASSTAMDLDDYSTGQVGAPLGTCKLRLVDWDEGNYHVTDKPNPRGEIIVGGDCVTSGYYKLEEQTKESFKEEFGSRWFYTGDIGEVLPNGSFKIIDRKKDLVKLAFGEYIALGKVEAELKTCPLVENICVLGRGTEMFLVAMVVPNRPNLEKLAKEMGKNGVTFEALCDDESIRRIVVQRIREHGQKCRLFGSELPRKVKLCSQEWLPESGLVTAALKIRRKMIEEHYGKDIDLMYAVSEANGDAVPPSKANSSH